MIKSSAYFIAYGAIIYIAIVNINPAKADDYFNPAFVTDPTGKKIDIDLSKFEKTDYLPGSYHVDIFINNNYINTSDVKFVFDEKLNKLIPCFSSDELYEYGIKSEFISELGSSSEECINLSLSDDVETIFIGTQNKLTLSIPQINFDQKKIELQQELLWDDGIPVVFSDYNISGYHQNDTKNKDKSDSIYANLRTGVNFGAWRYRNYSSWNKNSDGTTKWDNQLNYIERPWRAIKSNILIGDNFSDSDVFDNVSFRGVKLWSDSQMRPDYAGIYAPAIKGVAAGDSIIEVYQNGYAIYRTNVPSGPYELTDVVPLNNGSNLYVTQIGTDGSEQKFIIPFSSLDFLQRKNSLKYSFTAGQYRMNNYESNNSGDKTKFIQSDVFYGITDNTTIFGGIQSASRYQAYDFGMGINIPVFGAVSTDIMLTRADPDKLDVMNGRAFRLRYSKDILSTGTSVSFAGYRYMGGDYLSMTDLFDYYLGQDNTNVYAQRKGQLDLSLSQSLPESWGTITASVSTQTYDTYHNDNEKKIESYNVGYFNNFDDFSLSVNYFYYKDTIQRRNYKFNSYEDQRTNDHVLSLNISIPLKGDLNGNWISYGASKNKNGDFDNYIGVGGTALDDSSLTWNVQQGYGNHGRNNYGSVYSKYKTGFGDMTASYAYQKNSRQINYGMNGSFLASKYGITLSRPLGETNGLVYAPGAKGTRIINDFGSSIDSQGLAVISGFSPYRSNVVQLDVRSLPEYAEIDNTLKEVFPTRGAVVLVDYKTRIGSKILVTLRDKSGELIPFGAYAESDDDKEQFYVSNYGRLYMSGANDSDTILVVWGSQDQKQCRFSYNVKDKKKINGLYIFDQVCE